MMPQGVIQVRIDCCRQAGCKHELDYADPCAQCPDGHWGRYSMDCASVEKPSLGLGDIVEIVAKPIARALNLPCLDGQGNLKPGSGCAKRRDYLNRITKP